MGEKKHALLSASGAKKWINCTPCARLEEQFPETESEAAREGTLAHEFCELKLRKLFVETSMSEATYKRRLNKLRKHELYQKEMDGYTDFFVEAVSNIAYSFPVTPRVVVEKEVSYGVYAQEGFGTADCILLSGSVLHVFDFKYGHRPVRADHNPQMMLYALGAVLAYGFIYPIQQVVMHIVQPRVSKEPNLCEISLSELLQWGEEIVKPAAALAWEGKGEFKQGEWCDDCYCALAGSCRHRAEENLQLAETAGQPLGSLSYTELGDVLRRGKFVASWLKKVEAWVTELLNQGKAVPGWKLVEGRANRVITDTDKAFDALIAAGYQEDLLYNTVPLPLTKLEELIRKEDKEILNQFITRPPAGPVLAEESDKRPAYSRITPEEAFKENKEVSHES